MGGVGTLLAVSAVIALGDSAGPSGRYYDGAGAVPHVAARQQPATDEPPPAITPPRAATPPPSEPEPAGLPSEPEPEPEPEPGPEPDGAAADATETDAAGEATPGAADPTQGPSEELTMDDVFGTAADRDTAVEAPPETSPTAPATPPGRLRAHLAAKLETRIRIVSSAYYDVARVPERQFGRNENRLEFYFSYNPNKHIQIVGDIEPVFFGVSQARELDDLATQQLLTPFHIESDAAYVALNDLLPNLDIKIGRQVLVWGTADKFNPTNNINSDDLEDRPLFTEPIANQMVVVDYAPLDDKLWFEGVYVPLFYPALLPPSAAAALKDPQAPVPFAYESDLVKITQLQGLLRSDPRLVPTVSAHVKMPKRRFSDGQSAIKLGTSLGGVDMSLSYYNGRHDIPTPARALASTKDPVEGDGQQAECCFKSDVTLVYPRMQVLGADFTTQLPFLNNLGAWGEGALFFPRAHDLYIEFPIPVDVTPADGVANPVRSMQGRTIRSTPFIKATAGVDYTFGKHVYVQMQYLRGFIDEFGAGHIGNYLVGGSDLVFFGRHLVFRLFGVVDIPSRREDRGSYVIFPELSVIPPWGSVTFQLGSFVLFGAPRTKFGQPATGSSIVYGKVTGAF